MQIFSTISNMMGPFGLLYLAGGLGFVMILVALTFLLKKQPDPLDKLKTQNRSAPQPSEIKTERLREAARKDKLEKYATFLEPQNAVEFSAVKLKLMQAGYRSQNAVRFFYFSQFALAMIGLAIGGVLVIIKMNQVEMSIKDISMWLLGPGVIGYMAPKYWVTRRQATRQEAIENGFPDSLDMLLVCVEAGQSLDQAIIRVSKELKNGFPDLAYEFEVVSNEMKAGKDKATVLRDLSERAGVTDITSFVTVLIQSQQFGTSIADALRVYSAEMRDKRVMRAEEKANKLPTKMTLATMMLTVPPLLLLLIGPSIYKISQNMGG